MNPAVPAMDGQPVRDAATVVLVRRGDGKASVLMGMRGAKAVFMPSKYVFPGGAVDPEDRNTSPVATLDPRLVAEPYAGVSIQPHALISCARRELLEETGLVLKEETLPIFFFRAITPPGRPRRFDARFFLYETNAVTNNIDDFSAACDELSHLHWVPLSQARSLALPFITEVALAEVEAIVQASAGGPLQPPQTVPFFDNRGPEPRFSQII